MAGSSRMLSLPSHTLLKDHAVQHFPTLHLPDMSLLAYSLKLEAECLCVQITNRSFFTQNTSTIYSAVHFIFISNFQCYQTWSHVGRLYIVLVTWKCVFWWVWCSNEWYWNWEVTARQVQGNDENIILQFLPFTWMKDLNQKKLSFWWWNIRYVVKYW
jgi:hypothetical protein